MKKAAIYARVSTPDQHLETQLYDLRKLAAQRGFEIVHEYCDRGISGSKAKRHKVSRATVVRLMQEPKQQEIVAAA
jgi:DNA invertase Pin-like site-specific DNA recombinase